MPPKLDQKMRTSTNNPTSGTRVKWRVEFWCEENAIGEPKWIPYIDGEFEEKKKAKQALENAKDDRVRLIKITEEVIET